MKSNLKSLYINCPTGTVLFNLGLPKYKSKIPQNKYFVYIGKNPDGDGIIVRKLPYYNLYRYWDKLALRECSRRWNTIVSRESLRRYYDSDSIQMMKIRAMTFSEMKNYCGDTCIVPFFSVTPFCPLRDKISPRYLNMKHILAQQQSTDDWKWNVRCAASFARGMSSWKSAWIKIPYSGEIISGKIKSIEHTGLLLIRKSGNSRELYFNRASFSCEKYNPYTDCYRKQL